jgi:hypothetical protein
MIKGRDTLIVICLLYFLLYTLIGNTSNDYWSCGYFISLYIMLYEAIDFHRNKVIRKVVKGFSIILTLFTICKYILGVEIDREVIGVLFGIIFTGICILNCKNNVYKCGFF